ncbi:MAG: hypothetical protein RR622_09150 [Hydrogenoanaerobacterium sp.]
MSRYFLYDTRFSEFEQMMMLVPNFIPRKKGLIVMENLADESSQGSTDCKILVKSCFADSRNRYFNKRLQKLMQSVDGDCFLNTNHKQRFMSKYNSYMHKKNCAILYLLSVDEDLWQRSYRSIHADRITLTDISLRGISTDGYAVYQTARTVSTGKEHIYINEIADDQLIGDFAFKAIILGILVARYGGEVLSLRK